MANKGLILDEPDERIEFLATTADTNGELVRCRIRVAPGRPAPPEHSHPRQQETFSVEQGRMGIIVGKETLEADAGQVVVVPVGTNHTFWNAGDGSLVVVGDIRPALRVEDFVETIHVLIRDGKLRAGGKGANPLLMAVVAREFRREWRLTRLSPIVRGLLPLLAAVGRLAGYRGRHSIGGERADREIATTV